MRRRETTRRVVQLTTIHLGSPAATTWKRKFETNFDEEFPPSENVREHNRQIFKVFHVITRNLDSPSPHFAMLSTRQDLFD